jgi:selenide,water dikinase
VRDDAAVYRINATTAIVQTLDFFPPIVDDPYAFGAIAAANALSDVYAMGGRPVVALSIAAFPANLPDHMAQAILQGGIDKVAEAGAVLAGGHTVNDREPKYGLCVTGLIDPNSVTRKANAQPGDILLLTKPLGTGIITTAAKQDRGAPEHLETAVASMLTLNKRAAELAQQVEVHSVTDVTGYGLLGHAAELARNSGVGLRIDASALPLLPGTLDYARAEIAPGGLFTNQIYLEQDGYVRYAREIDRGRKLVLFDPQTSGGLLMTLPPDATHTLEQLYRMADQACWRIGTVMEGSGIEVS